MIEEKPSSLTHEVEGFPHIVQIFCIINRVDDVRFPLVRVIEHLGAICEISLYSVTTVKESYVTIYTLKTNIFKIFLNKIRCNI